MKHPCHDCHHVHASTDTYAVDRFNPSGARGFRADYPDSPLRNCRAKAEADMCLHRQETT